MIKKEYSAREGRYVYRFDIRVTDGRRVRRVRGTRSTKKLAEDAINETKTDATRGTYRFRADRANITFKELKDAFVTAKSRTLRYMPRVTRALDAFEAQLGPDRRVEDIDEDDLRAFVETRRNQKNSAATINQYLIVIRSCLRAAPQLFRKQLGHWRAPRIEREPEPPRRRARILTPEEAAAILSKLRVISPVAHDVAFVCLHIAARIGEVRNLEWKDVLWQCVGYTHGAIRITHTKTNQPRTVPMPREVAALLRRRQGQAKGELVFEGQKPGRPYTQIYHAWRRACDEAKIPAGRKNERGVIIHDLRRTAITQMRRKGIDPETAAAIAGNSPQVMFQFYSRTDSVREQKAADAMGDFLSEPDAEALKSKQSR